MISKAIVLLADKSPPPVKPVEVEMVVLVGTNPVAATVIVSVVLLVVILILLPAAKVSVSVLESATTSSWPLTEIVSKLLDEPPPVALNVIVSVPASVVIVMLVPATSVKVSAPVSATTSDWPDTAIVLKLSEPPPPVELIVIVSVPASVVIVILEPAAKVSVSEVASATTLD